MTTHLLLPNAGIDLGFFQVKTASGRGTTRNSTEIHTNIFPSFAPTIASSNKGLMALRTRDDSAVVDVDGVSFFVGESSMDMIDASGHTRAFNEEYCLSPIYRALFLGALWQIAKRYGVKSSLTIKHLVLGLPITTIAEYKAVVRDKALGTHFIPCPFEPDQNIKVTIEDVLVVAQPHGRAVAYAQGEGRNKVKPDSNILVLDMGGGTFDWFVCNGRFNPNTNACGALPTGTLNCASEIMNSIKPALVNFPGSMARVDVALRAGGESFDLAGVTYKIGMYTKQVDTLIGGAIDRMRMKVGNLGSLDHILLTGGGASLLERVSERSLERFKHLIRVDPDPVYSNVKGFFVISEMVTRAQSQAR